jgi:viologen exporter family transport system permease protein
VINAGRAAPGYWALVGAGYRRWATYRQAAVAGVFVNTVFGIIKLSILLAVARSAGGSVAGYDRAALSTYAWVSQGLIAVVMIFTWTELADRVRTGDIAVDLARPVDLQLSWLAADLGRAAWSLFSRAIVPIVFGAVFFGFHVPTDPTAVLLLAPSILLAVCVSFACRFMLNLSAFWLTEIRGIVLLYVLVSGVLAGHLIPVQLFPGWLQAVAYATPFPAMVQTPINLVTGLAVGATAGRQVAEQLAWAIALLLLGRLVLARATRKLVVQGG